EIRQQEAANLLFSTANIERMMIVGYSGVNQGFIGMGNNFITPRSKLHLNSSSKPSEYIYAQWTNFVTGNATENNGLRVGIDQDGNAQLRQEEESLPIQFWAKNPNNMLERMRLISGTYMINQIMTTNITRAAIWENGIFPTEPNSLPLALFHIGGPEAVNISGHRDWMDRGTYCNIPDEEGPNMGFNMYTGLQTYLDPINHTTVADAIINWGNSSLTDANTRTLRFVYTTDQTGGTTSSLYQGLETSRWICDGNVIKIGFGGDPLSTVNVYTMGGGFEPGNTVEINSPEITIGSGPTFSGLRFTDMNSTATPTVITDKVLSVDDNGDVILVTASGGGGFGAACVSPTPYDLLSNWRVGLGDNNLYFANGINVNNSSVNNVVIGKDCTSALAKLDVLQSSASGGSVGLNVLNNDYGTATSNAFGIKSLIDGISTDGNNIGGYFQAKGNKNNVAGEFFSYNLGLFSNRNWAIWVPKDGGKVQIGAQLSDNPPFILTVYGEPACTVQASWTMYSDSLLKTNILPYQDGLYIVRQINPVLYEYNGLLGLEPNVEHVGIIAQQLANIAPYMVDTVNVVLDTLTGVETPVLTLNSDAFSYMNINAIKELDSAVTILQQTVPPEKPILVLPADGSADIPLTVTFSWEKSERATSYTLTVTSGLKPNVETISVNTTDTFAVVSLSNYCTTYGWWVTAYNQGSASYDSDRWLFTTETPDFPPAPALDSPADYAIDLPLSNTFSWYHSENAEKYNLYISTNTAAGEIMVTQVTTEDTFAVANVPDFNTAYKWWIVAENCGGKSPDSEKFRFVTSAPPPPPLPPVLASPVNGDSLYQLSQPFFRWHRSEGATQYSVYVSTTPDDMGIIYNNTVVDTFSNFDPYIQDTTYYWWVTACNQYSCGDNSEMWSFVYASKDTKKSADPILSDSLYKTNESPLTDALSKVIQLNGVYFFWDTDQYPELKDTTRQIGFIAQEVNPVIPELVTTDAEGVQYVDYGRMVPVLTEAIKEMKTQNDDQQAQINALQTQLTQIQDVLAQCCSGTKSMTIENTGDMNSSIEITPDNSFNKNTELLQNNPNPFSYKTTFTYNLGTDGFTELEIHDQYGTFITALVSENQTNGRYSIVWDAAGVSPGIYYYSLKVDGIVLVKKAIKIR
ncbi:MAG: tail fiber domain-containing protein, partial [Bacteroidota bacterium]